MLLKCYTQYATKFAKFSSGHRTGNGQFSFQSQRKAMPKNVQTTDNCTHLTHFKVMLKILQARLQQYVNHELPDFQAGFRQGGGARDQIANICWIIKKAREFQKNIYFCLLAMSKPLCGSQKLENSRDGNTRPPDLPPEKSVCRSRSKRSSLGIDWFQIGRLYIGQPAYLTYMQSIS